MTASTITDSAAANAVLRSGRIASASLRFLPTVTQRADRRATWTVWLGCVDRAPEGQRAPHAPAPALPLPPPPFSSPAFAFGGLQGGYSPHASAALNRKTKKPDT